MGPLVTRNSQFLPVAVFLWCAFKLHLALELWRDAAVIGWGKLLPSFQAYHPLHSQPLHITSRRKLAFTSCRKFTTAEIEAADEYNLHLPKATKWNQQRRRHYRRKEVPISPWKTIQNGTKGFGGSRENKFWRLSVSKIQKVAYVTYDLCSHIKASLY